MGKNGAARDLRDQPFAENVWFLIPGEELMAPGQARREKHDVVESAFGRMMGDLPLGRWLLRLGGVASGSRSMRARAGVDMCIPANNAVAGRAAGADGSLFRGLRCQRNMQDAKAVRQGREGNCVRQGRRGKFGGRPPQGRPRGG